MIKIQLNGQPHDLPGAVSVAGLLAEIGIDAAKVAVEKNGEIVPRSQFTAAQIAGGDAVEVIHFVGGG